MLLLLIAGGVAWLLLKGPEPVRVITPAVSRALGPVELAFREMAADPALAGAALAFCVVDDQGNVAYASPLAGTAMAPASALKTLVTGAALGVLGPEFRFETLLSTTAPPGADGVLKGDLVLVGAGDPTLSKPDLDRLAKNVAGGGLKRIEGRVRVDASIFPHNPVSDHWNWGDLGNAYGAGSFGINVEHNQLLIRFDPGEKPGDAATVAGATNALKDIEWINHVVTGPSGSGDQVVAFSEPYGRRITLRGSVPLGEPGFQVQAANPDPPALAREWLAAALGREGIEIRDAEVVDPGDSADLTVLAVHRSAELKRIIGHLHRVSDNVEAQCLFLRIGRELGREPGEAVREYWTQAGVNFVGLRLLDGSGLARANMIRPLDLVAVNHAAKSGAQGEIFRESLAACDGGQVRSKLGGMSGVRTEVGFFQIADGSERTFTLMANGLGRGSDLRRHRAALLAAAQGGE